VTDADLPTLGYKVEKLNDDDTWVEVFNAETNPDSLNSTIYGLVSAKYYTFRVYSVNFNGPSVASSTFSIYACGLPRQFSVPQYVDSSTTFISFNWTSPLDNGGCPIFDYGIFRDTNGDGLGPWTEVNPVASFPRQDPYLSYFKCETFPTSTASGSPFTFKIVAHNLQGTVDSVVSAPMLLAARPGKPASGPTADVANTN
jgi:hypothetical protein